MVKRLDHDPSVQEKPVPKPKMETRQTCSRCGGVFGTEPATVTVAASGGALSEADPVLELCSDCASSMARWLARKHRKARVSEPEQDRQPEDSSRRRPRAEKDRRRKPRKRAKLVRTIVLYGIFCLITFLIIMGLLYLA
jgi:hypothetical protein